jgi:hypothetical protein
VTGADVGVTGARVGVTGAGVGVTGAISFSIRSLHSSSLSRSSRLDHLCPLPHGLCSVPDSSVAKWAELLVWGLREWLQEINMVPDIQYCIFNALSLSMKGEPILPNIW